MTGVPDYIAPIVGYRVWQWDVAGLRSLNGERWRAGEQLETRCRVCDFVRWRGRPSAVHSPNTAPHIQCSCGIYAHKSWEHLRQCGYERSRIHGQVLLWGTVVEHQYGWRGQYAYPKCFFLPSEALPVTLTEIQARLLALIPYRCEIFILRDEGRLLLWNEDSGFGAAGLDYLSNRGNQWYARHNQESTIKQGDRVAIVGQGPAVVEEIDHRWIRAVLGDKRVVRIARERVCWNDQNVRWETDTHAY